MKKIVILIFGCFMLIPILCSCNGTSTVDLVIKDGRITTNLTCNAGITVAQALSQAEISIGKNDKISPSLTAIVDEAKNNTITLKRYYTVTLNCDGKTTKYTSYGGKVKDIIKKSKITLNKNDIVEPSSDCFLSDGIEIKVYRMARVTLTVDGETVEKLTKVKTVARFLRDNNVTLGKMDIVEPTLNTSVSEGMKITVKRVTTKNETVTETIAYSTESRYDNSMDKGTSKVSQSGVNGKKEVTYLITYTDGTETDREIVSEVVVSEPVNKIVVYGSKVDTNPVVSKQKIYDCDGSGNGYYVITYADGTVKYEDFFNGG